MKFSYHWLQTYFNSPLPAPVEIEQALVLHSFEVEELKATGDDIIFNIKILPDRAHDCLGHRGLAKELSILFNLPLKSAGQDSAKTSTDRPLSVRVEDKTLCRRYIGRVIENVTVGPSPRWLVERLQLMDQRPILNIVDATNFVMFDIGQPLHAFDADKIKGEIVVRRARAGEQITTLDDEKVTLDPTILVIADEEAPLAVAGIKGGRRAEITEETKNIILEAANFEPTNIRRTTLLVNIKTDSSKRFEHDLAPELAARALEELSVLILSFSSKAKAGEIVDRYPTLTVKPRTITFTVSDIASRLGEDLSINAIAAVLKQGQFTFEQEGNNFKITIPAERLDLKIMEDMVEEIGRLYGYDKIEGRMPASGLPAPAGEVEQNPEYEKMNAARGILLSQGWSEEYGYSLTETGPVPIENPLTASKGFIRANLSDWLSARAVEGLRQTLFDAEAVKYFEIGKTFSVLDGCYAETKSLALALASRATTKVARTRQTELAIRESLTATLRSLDVETGGSAIVVRKDAETIVGSVEVAFDDLQIKAGGDLSAYLKSDLRYQKISAYPRVLRDVALFVPAATGPEKVAAVIKNSAGPLLNGGPVKFDEFHKDGKVSYAFRIIFQSHERTLSDGEVNQVMAGVVAALEKKEGWMIRK